MAKKNLSAYKFSLKAIGEKLDLPVTTMNYLRLKSKKSPKGIKKGRLRFYSKADLDTYRDLASKMRKNRNRAGSGVRVGNANNADLAKAVNAQTKVLKAILTELQRPKKISIK